MQVYGNAAVLGDGGNPQDFAFLIGTLGELNSPSGGSIPVEAKNNQWNWVLFRVPNDERPSGLGRYVGTVPDGAGAPPLTVASKVVPFDSKTCQN